MGSGGGTSGPATTLTVVTNTDLGTETMELASLQPSQGPGPATADLSLPKTSFLLK